MDVKKESIVFNIGKWLVYIVLGIPFIVLILIPDRMGGPYG